MEYLQNSESKRFSKIGLFLERVRRMRRRRENNNTKNQKMRAKKVKLFGSLPDLLSHNREYKRRSQSLPWPEAHFASAKPPTKRLVCPTRVSMFRVRKEKGKYARLKTEGIRQQKKKIGAKQNEK